MSGAEYLILGVALSVASIWGLSGWESARARRRRRQSLS